MKTDWRIHYVANVGSSRWPMGRDTGGRVREVQTRHLTVKRRSGKDGISWDVLQRIKDEMLGPDVLAIEIYPPADFLINTTNLRHLWEVPLDLVDQFPSLAY